MKLCVFLGGWLPEVDRFQPRSSWPICCSAVGQDTEPHVISSKYFVTQTTFWCWIISVLLYSPNCAPLIWTHKQTATCPACLTVHNWLSCSSTASEVYVIKLQLMTHIRCSNKWNMKQPIHSTRIKHSLNVGVKKRLKSWNQYQELNECKSHLLFHSCNGFFIWLRNGNTFAHNKKRYSVE